MEKVQAQSRCCSTCKVAEPAEPSAQRRVDVSMREDRCEQGEQVGACKRAGVSKMMGEG